MSAKSDGKESTHNNPEETNNHHRANCGQIEFTFMPTWKDTVAVMFCALGKANKSHACILGRLELELMNKLYLVRIYMMVVWLRSP